MRKKGMLSMEVIIIGIIVIATAVVALLIIIKLRGGLGGLGEFFKNLLRFKGK